MTNELTTVSNWGAFKEQAEMLVKSGFLPVSINTPEKALAIAMTAKELGVGVMEGFRSINIIQGKPCVSPQLMLALAMRTGQLQQIKYDSTDERCRITIIRKGWEPHTEEFGVKEATALGLINRDNYRKQAAIMFRWRALAAGLRVTFSDVVLGLYNPEEMGAEVRTNSEGDMEIIDDQMVNTGVRVPAGFSKMTPEEQQERIGAGNVVRGTETGKFIFTSKQAIESFKEQFPVKELNGPRIEPGESTEASESPIETGFITHDEQLEIFRLAKEKKIHHLSLKKSLKDNFGIEGTKLITKEMYPRVIEMIYKS
jgi:hypothetical protein